MGKWGRLRTHADLGKFPKATNLSFSISKVELQLHLPPKVDGRVRGDTEYVK